jgi:F0F1-type ATP synthase delta subunit
VRVENTSFLVDGISYYWNSIAIGATKAGAEWTVANIIENAKDITKNALERWTAFSSDTCNTQRKVWAVLNTKKEAAHVLSVPCDSHGIQLVFKDLLFLGKDQNHVQIVTEISKFFKSFSNKIVSAFSSSDKQLAYLREAMKKSGTGIISLINTVPT